MSTAFNTDSTLMLDDHASTSTSTPIDELRRRVTGDVFTPGDAGYVAATAAWNRAAVHTPSVAVVPVCIDDVVAAVEFASRHEIGLGIQATGHGAVLPVDGLLLVTNRLQSIDIDPVAHTATVGAGCTSGQVLAAAQQHGLAPLVGSSPTVGIVGFTLGGGFGWLARKYGPACDAVQSFQVITPSGALITASRHENTDVFVALRGGGGGAIGIVVTMTITLFPVSTVYAGSLFYPATAAATVIDHYARWADYLPDGLTTSVTLMNFPPFPEIPEPIRGQSFVIVRGCWTGDIATGREIIDSWRTTMPPILDMWQEIPFAQMATITSDPVEPMPIAATGAWMNELDGHAAAIIAANTFPQGGPPAMMFSEIRHLGGAVDTEGQLSSMGNRDARFLLHMVAIPTDPATGLAIMPAQQQLIDALGGYVSDRIFRNFVDGRLRRDAEDRSVDPSQRQTLRSAQQRLDPNGMLRYGVDHRRARPPAGCLRVVGGSREALLGAPPLTITACVRPSAADTPRMDSQRSTLMLHDPAVAGVGDLDRYVDLRHLQPAYQPIVDIASGEVVGYEALARWPTLAGATPDAVFAAARLAGRTSELDWACRLTAMQGALDAGMGTDHVLFVNVEPEALASAVPPGGQQILDAAHRSLRVMLELTERSLVRRPAELLRVVEWARGQGWGIALDDVGAEPESLALLPFLAPDVVKLDMSLIRQRPTPDQASIMAAVMSHAERTGAVLLSEGIETEDHLDQALALGATLAQGWMFGRPAALLGLPTPHAQITLGTSVPPVAVTPFSLIEGHPRLRIGRKALLLDLSMHIENQGMQLSPPPVVLSAFQTADRFTPGTNRRYARLAARCPLVAALGHGLDQTMPGGVHGASLADTDPLLGEWTVTTIGSHHAAALIARDLGDTGPDLQRRFEFLVTHDRDLVLAVARSLMSRIIT